MPIGLYRDYLSWSMWLKKWLSNRSVLTRDCDYKTSFAFTDHERRRVGVSQRNGRGSFCDETKCSVLARDHFLQFSAWCCSGRRKGTRANTEHLASSISL